MDPTLGGQDQRVDLDQIGVALDIGRVELLEDGHRAFNGGFGQGGGGHPFARRGLVKPVHRVDPHLGNRVGSLLSHHLDLHAAFGRQHAKVLLGRPVQGERCVVLLGDVGRLLDPNPSHHMATDV